MKTTAFIDQKAFRKLIGAVRNTQGEPYKKVGTIYRDLSRLVVVWVHNTKGSELQRVYNASGWKGKANVRALRQCAKEWLNRHHPELLVKG